MSKDKQEQPGQLERFKETARKLGVDEDEGAFKKKLGVIARQGPKSQTGRHPGKVGKSKITPTKET